MVAIKRVYDPPSPDDGQRVLVDRLWPRGLSKPSAHIDTWVKEIAPSDELRRWFGHDPARFDEFRRRYLEELKEEPARTQLAGLTQHAAHEAITLVFGAKDPEHNNAVVLADEIERRLRAGGGTAMKRSSAKARSRSSRTGRLARASGTRRPATKRSSARGASGGARRRRLR